MPRNDGSGPLGYGPRSGRGMGRCRPAPNAFNSTWGRGARRRGCGFGFGRANYNYPAGLKEYQSFLQEELKHVNQETEKLGSGN